MTSPDPKAHTQEPAGTVNGAQAQAPGKVPSTFQNFLGGILDLRFQRNLTMQLLPLFYLVLLLGAAGIVLLIVAGAFWLSLWAGVVTLLVAPFGFLAAVAVIRAALEYMVLAYRIMETVNRMDRIPGQVDNLNARVDYITAEFDRVAAEVHHIRDQVDGVTDTVHLLRPVLNPLSLPGKLMRSYNKRHSQN